MEEYKSEWTDQDYDIMSWHDCTLYSINFLKKEFSLELEIDYIFNWEKNDDHETGHKFTVAPCILKFVNYSDLEINIPWNQTYDVIINEVQRSEPFYAPNNEIMMAEYNVILETGFIKLKATGFNMNLLSKPIVIESQNIEFSARKNLL